jgi:N-acetylglutamate synthase-like GNAT family acetyltransferase
MRVEVRKMTADDLPGALALLARYNLEPRPPSPEAPEPERTRLDPEHSFVALEGGRVVGVSSYIVLGPDLAETASVVVDPRWLRMGVLERLTEAKFAELRARGIRRLRAETDRPGTVRWMVRNLGYRVVGAHPKRHDFGLPGVREWTVLELEL